VKVSRTSTWARSGAPRLEFRRTWGGMPRRASSAGEASRDHAHRCRCGIRLPRRREDTGPQLDAGLRPGVALPADAGAQAPLEALPVEQPRVPGASRPSAAHAPLPGLDRRPVTSGREVTLGRSTFRCQAHPPRFMVVYPRPAMYPPIIESVKRSPVSSMRVSSGF